MITFWVSRVVPLFNALIQGEPLSSELQNLALKTRNMLYCMV